MRALFGTLLVFAIGCGELPKAPPSSPDFGDEAGAEKDDSATRPTASGALTSGKWATASFTGTTKWRAFTFAGRAGTAIDLYAAGRSGLDTVAYLYKLSGTTGRPYGRPLAVNDDTDDPGAQNPYGSPLSFA